MARARPRLRLAVLLAFGLGAAPLFAAPLSLRYAGRLTDAGGRPVAGPVDLELSFLAGPGADAALVAGPFTFPGVTLSEGTFAVDVALADADLAAIFPAVGQAAWLEVKDRTHGRTYARQSFSPVPYAFKVPVDGVTLKFDEQGRLTSGSTVLRAATTTATVKLQASDATPAGTAYTLPPQPVAGGFLKVAADGSLSWDAPAGAGDITDVVAGTGLDGGAASGAATLGIAPGGVGPNELAADAVTTAKLKDGEVKLADLDPTICGANQVLKMNGAGTALGCAADANSVDVGDGVSAGGTASVYKARSGNLLQLRGLSAGSNRITVTENSGDITLDVDQTKLSLAALTGKLTLLGDVTGDHDANSVASVGGKTAAQVAASVELTVAATASATGGTLAKRDAAGDLAAGTLTLSPSADTKAGLIVQGRATQTADLQEWRASDGSVLAAVTAGGAVKLSDADGTPHFASVRAAATMTADVTYTLPPAPVNGQFLKTDAAGVLSWAAPASSGGDVMNGGQTGPLRLGTNDAAALTLETDDTARVTVDAAGKVGIGTASPDTLLDVAGDIQIGSSASACAAAADEGKMRYNGTSKKIEYCDGASWIALGEGTPSGTIAFFLTACPSGWTDYAAAQGRVIVAAAANLGSTVGTALGDLGTRTITSVPAHTHTIDPPSTGTTAAGSHAHVIDPPNTATTTDPGHQHLIDPPNTATTVDGNHSHSFTGLAAMGAPGSSYNIPWGGGNTGVAGAHQHTVDIAPFWGGAAGAHNHTMDIAPFWSDTAADHTHAVDIAPFTSGSTGAASVDVSMPYIQLRACKRN